MESHDKIVCAVFILKDDGSALLQHRDNKAGITHPGRWTIPGGHCLPGEKPEDCAKREVFEETGYKCKILVPTASFLDDDFLEGKHIPYPLHLFCTPFDETQTVKCLEGQAIEFVGRKAALSKPFLDFLFPYWDRSIDLIQRLKESKTHGESKGP